MLGFNMIWGAWHLPYYLFFLSSDYLSKFTTLDLAAYIPLVMVVYVAWAIVFGKVWLRTRAI